MNAQPVQRQQPQFQICYQMSTNNRSFLEMHYYLKKVGIQNNKFMLMLLDPGLAGVDPHDPELSREMKARIFRECKFNFWYFIREVTRIPETGKAVGVRYKLHRGNLALNFCLLMNMNVFFELPRQQGKSVSAVTWYLWVYNFATANAEITFLNKSMKDSKLNLARLKDQRDALPSYLQFSQEYSLVGNKKKRLPSTVETIQHTINSNIIKTAPSAKNETSAANLLRGRTITCLWADEWAFIPYNKIIYSNTVPALMTAFLNAKAAGSPYGILVTTTPGILSCIEGQYAFDMINDATIFSERWYDKTPAELTAIIAANQNSTFVYIKFNYRQVGRDETWFAQTCKEMGLSNFRDIRREILLEWTDSPENCPFNDETLETISSMVHDPILKEEIVPGHVLNIYEKIPLRKDFVPKYPPIIGVDVAGGFSHDASAVTVIDSRTTKVIADYKCNYISPIDLARIILGIVNKFYPNAIVNIERNGGFGASVIAKLKESKIKSNLYFEIKDRIIEETTDGHRIHRKKLKTKVYGLDSTHDVREDLIEILRQRAELHKDKFVSPVILGEMKMMQQKRNGKVEHSNNSHDDQVFSYLMALYVWYNGKNLKEFFNIDKKPICTENKVDDTVTDLDEQYSSVIEEVEFIEPEEGSVKEEVEKSLAMVQSQKVITLDKYIAKVREEEDDMLRDMLRDRATLKAYANHLGMTDDEVKEQFLEGEMAIPDSVFTNFAMDPEEIMNKKLMDNFNFRDFPTQ